MANLRNFTESFKYEIPEFVPHRTRRSKSMYDMSNPAINDQEFNERRYAEYSQRAAGMDRFNSMLDFLGSNVQELSNKTDEFYGKAIESIKDIRPYVDEASTIATEEHGRTKDYLDELRGMYEPAIKDWISKAREGVLDEYTDYRGEMNRAEADVAEQYADAEGSFMRDMERYGGAGGSEKYASSRRQALLDEAGARAKSREEARLSERDRAERAKLTNYQALQTVGTTGQSSISSTNNLVAAAAEMAARAKLQGAETSNLEAQLYGQMGETYGKGTSDAMKGFMSFVEGNAPSRTEAVPGGVEYYKPTGIFRSDYTGGGGGRGGRTRAIGGSGHRAITQSRL